MDNNDILRRIRYTFDFKDEQMIEIFGLADKTVNRSMVSDWLKREDEETYEELEDLELAIFLNGFIALRRGKREGPSPAPEKILSNNAILRKLKIALELKTEDIQDIFTGIDKKISVHEISAFLRNPKQSQFRHCNDQYLRNFMTGIQQKYRPKINE